MDPVTAFLDSPLITWIKSLHTLHDTPHRLENFTDAVIFWDIFQRIDVRARGEELHRQNNLDANGRLQNWSHLFHLITTYYQDVLQQTVVLSLPDCEALVNNPADENSLEYLRRIALLVLGCAVQCEEKETYIRGFSLLDYETQEALVQSIKQITETSEVVVSNEQLNEGSLGAVLSAVVTERNQVHKRLSDALQEVVYFKHELDCKRGGVVTVPKTLDSYHVSRELQELRTSVERLRKEIETKSTLLMEAREEMENMAKTCGKLRAENATFSAEAKLSRTYRDELDAMSEKLQNTGKLEKELAKYKNMSHELEYYKTRTEELKSANSTLSELNSRSEEELSRLYSQVQQASSELTSIQQRFHTMKEEKNALQEKLEEVLEEKVTLQIEHQKLTSEEPKRRQLRTSTSSEYLQGANIVGSGGHPLAEELADTMNSHLTRLEAENFELKREIESIKSQLLETQQEMEQLIYQSEEEYQKKCQKYASKDQDRVGSSVLGHTHWVDGLNNNVLKETTVASGVTSSALGPNVESVTRKKDVASVQTDEDKGMLMTSSSQTDERKVQFLHGSAQTDKAESNVVSHSAQTDEQKVQFITDGVQTDDKLDQFVSNSAQTDEPCFKNSSTQTCKVEVNGDDESSQKARHVVHHRVSRSLQLETQPEDGSKNQGNYVHVVTARAFPTANKLMVNKLVSVGDSRDQSCQTVVHTLQQSAQTSEEVVLLSQYQRLQEEMNAVIGDISVLKKQVETQKRYSERLEAQLKVEHSSDAKKYLDLQEHVKELTDERNSLKNRVESVCEKLSKAQSEKGATEKQMEKCVQDMETQYNEYKQNEKQHSDRIAALEKEKQEWLSTKEQALVDDAALSCSRIRQLEKELDEVRAKCIAVESLNSYLSDVPERSQFDDYLPMGSGSRRQSLSSHSGSVRQDQEPAVQENYYEIPMDIADGSQTVHDFSTEATLRVTPNLGRRHERLVKKENERKSATMSVIPEKTKSEKSSVFSKFKNYVKPGKQSATKVTQSKELSPSEVFSRNSAHRRTVEIGSAVDPIVTHKGNTWMDEPIRNALSRENPMRQTMPSRISRNSRNYSYMHDVSHDSISSTSCTPHATYRPPLINKLSHNIEQSCEYVKMAAHVSPGNLSSNVAVVENGSGDASNSENNVPQGAKLDYVTNETDSRSWQTLDSRNNHRVKAMSDEIFELQHQNQRLKKENQNLKDLLEQQSARIRNGRGGLEREIELLRVENRKQKVIIETLQNTIAGKSMYDREYRFYTNV